LTHCIAFGQANHAKSECPGVLNLGSPGVFVHDRPDFVALLRRDGSHLCGNNGEFRVCCFCGRTGCEKALVIPNQFEHFGNRPVPDLGDIGDGSHPIRRAGNGRDGLDGHEEEDGQHCYRH
jgi:hypothetical protein